MRRHIPIWQGLWKEQGRFDAAQEKTHFLETDCRDEHGTTRHLKHPSTAAVHQHNLKVLSCKVPLPVLQWKSFTKPLQHALCQRAPRNQIKELETSTNYSILGPFPDLCTLFPSLLIRRGLKTGVCISKATLLVPMNGLLWNTCLKKRETSWLFLQDLFIKSLITLGDSPA